MAGLTGVVQLAVSSNANALNHVCGRRMNGTAFCGETTPMASWVMALKLLAHAARHPQHPVSPETADLDNDGRKDLVVSDDQRIEWYRNLGSGAFAAAATLSTAPPNSADFMLLADVNADGRRDVGLPDTTDALRWWMNAASGGLLRLPFTTGVAVQLPAFAADVNDDGKLDLVATAGVHTGDGTGTFVFVSAPPVPVATRVLADLDNDSRLDLAGTTPLSPWLALARGVPGSPLFSATAENYRAGVPLVDVANARLNSDASRDLVAIIGRPGARVVVSLPGVCR